MDKIDRLNEYLDELGDLEPHELLSFEQYLIGALSAIVTDAEWENALQTAQSCLARYGARRR